VTMHNRNRSGRCDQVTRRAWFACVVLVIVTTTVGAQNAAQDYPQWRGKSGDGSASAFVSPSTWPDSLNRRWRIDVGEGYATPLVIGDTVYVFARRDGNELLLSIDASTGAERWRSAYPLTYTPSSPTVAHGSGPKATPLFHEGKLFTLGVSGIVSAFECLSTPRRHLRLARRASSSFTQATTNRSPRSMSTPVRSDGELALVVSSCLR